MAVVIHTIKGGQYAYNHHREGKRVVCDYIGPVGSNGKKRKAKHGGGAPQGVTQHADDNTTDGKSINTIKDNISLPEKEKAGEKTIMSENRERMTTFRMHVKGERGRYEMIESDNPITAKKMFRAKNNLDGMKLKDIEARVILKERYYDE